MKKSFQSLSQIYKSYLTYALHNSNESVTRRFAIRSRRIFKLSAMYYIIED